MNTNAAVKFFYWFEGFIVVLSLILGVFFIVSGEWLWSIVMVIIAMSCIVTLVMISKALKQQQW
ncbi:hypothetical protein SAMN05421781_2753 [Marinococcus luteus]|uniref:Uncharacterized protein n=1 Tax=Marinococcus luteus TaxID=1122204 RepID=A0A1H2XHY8_9BACI|nr:hypothetical protein [Marinococcus luteus]SDW92416.1 hypothetical protein SAMN05421781_2753 [Marinococcus luteus]